MSSNNSTTKGKTGTSSKTKGKRNISGSITARKMSSLVDVTNDTLKGMTLDDLSSLYYETNNHRLKKDIYSIMENKLKTMSTTNNNISLTIPQITYLNGLIKKKINQGKINLNKVDEKALRKINLNKLNEEELEKIGFGQVNNKSLSDIVKFSSVEPLKFVLSPLNNEQLRKIGLNQQSKEKIEKLGKIDIRILKEFGIDQLDNEELNELTETFDEIISYHTEIEESFRTKGKTGDGIVKRTIALKQKLDNEKNKYDRAIIVSVAKTDELEAIWDQYSQLNKKDKSKFKNINLIENELVNRDILTNTMISRVGIL